MSDKPKLKVITGNKRETEAFEWYWAMDKRSLREVARHFKVSEASVRRWAKRHDWEGQVAARDQELAEQLKHRSMTKVAETTEHMLKLCEGVYARFAEALKNGSADIKASDFVNVARLELLLRGQATERSEQTVYNLMQEALTEFDKNYSGDDAV